MSGTSTWGDDYRRVAKLVDVLMTATAEVERADARDKWRSKCDAKDEAHLALLEAILNLAKRAEDEAGRALLEAVSPLTRRANGGEQP